MPTTRHDDDDRDDPLPVPAVTAEADGAARTGEAAGTLETARAAEAAGRAQPDAGTRRRRPHPRSWSRRRQVLAGLALVLAVVGAEAAVSLLLTRSDLLAARAALAATTGPDSAADSAVGRLSDAAQRLTSARHRLHDPGPALLAQVPVLGRSVRAVDHTTAATQIAVGGLAEVLRRAQQDRAHLDTEHLDAGALQDLSSAIGAARSQLAAPLARVRADRLGLTPGPVHAGVRGARNQLDDLDRGLARGGELLTALTGMTGANGPRSWLVVLENNAELRGGGGLVSVVAEMTARDGRLTVGKFRDVEDFNDPGPAGRTSVPAPPDYLARYGGFAANTTLWKNVNMSPDVPTASKIYSELAPLSLHHPVDAVLTIDVPAMAAVLRATGPARLPDGGTLYADHLVQAVLVDAYAGTADDSAGQEQRRHRLESVADATIGALTHSHPALAGLARELSGAAAGRHLALWSAVPAEQSALDAAGVSGAVDPGRGGDLVAPVVQNLGSTTAGLGNKLDVYTDREVDVHVTVGPQGATTTQAMTLRNDAPGSGLPRYVAGTPPGRLRELVSFAVPADADIAAFLRAGAAVDTSVAAEGGYRVLLDYVEIDPGQSVSWTLRYTTPRQPDGYALRLVPQPLAHDATLRLTVSGAPGWRLLGAQGYATATPPPGPWTRQSTVRLVLQRAPAWSRAAGAVRHFWGSPVTLDAQVWRRRG